MDSTSHTHTGTIQTVWILRTLFLSSPPPLSSLSSMIGICSLRDGIQTVLMSCARSSEQERMKEKILLQQTGKSTHTHTFRKLAGLGGGSAVLHMYCIVLHTHWASFLHYITAVTQSPVVFVIFHSAEKIFAASPSIFKIFNFPSTRVLSIKTTSELLRESDT